MDGLRGNVVIVEFSALLWGVAFDSLSCRPRWLIVELGRSLGFGGVQPLRLSFQEFVSRGSWRTAQGRIFYTSLKGRPLWPCTARIQLGVCAPGSERTTCKGLDQIRREKLWFAYEVACGTRHLRKRQGLCSRCSCRFRRDDGWDDLATVGIRWPY